MRKAQALIYLLFFLSVFTNIRAQAEALPANGLLWKISGNELRKPSYLFGTYHAKGGMQILDSIKGVEALLNSAEQLICESRFSIAAISNPKRSSESGKMITSLKPWPVVDSTYNNLLTVNQRVAFDSVFNSNKTIKGIIQSNLRPSSLMSFLKWSYSEVHDKSERKSTENLKPTNDANKSDMLDFYFQKLAKQQGKAIVELDLNNVYLKILEEVNSEIPQISYKKEVDMLMFYIANHARIDSMQREKSNKIISAYLKQNIGYLSIVKPNNESDLLDNLLQGDLVTAKLNERENRIIVVERNNMWMAKIPTLIKDKPSFIAVGAAHLPGEKGLVNQLRKLGYVVENILCVQ